MRRAIGSRLACLVLATGCVGDPVVPPRSIAQAGLHCLRYADEMWGYRCFLAVSEMSEDFVRVLTARREFVPDVIHVPEYQRAYLVSFAEPVSVRSLLVFLKRTDGLELHELHLWLAVPGSTSAPVGMYSAEALDWPQTTAAMVEAEDLRYLGQRLRGIRDLSGPNPHPVVREQLRDTRRIKAFILKHGSLAYGMRCRCSPEALGRLRVAMPALVLRAIEEDSVEDQPLRPEDRQRELLVQSGGRYGRG